LAAALHLATTTSAGIDEAAARASTTVQQVMPARLRHRIDPLQVTAVERAAAPPLDGGVLMAISAAVLVGPTEAKDAFTHLAHRYTRAATSSP
jgi:hypothetical protein